MEIITINSLKAGDVLSCQGSGFLAKAISKITKSKITHSAFVIDIWEELYIIDSQRRGTNPIKYKDWIKKYGYIVTVHRNFIWTKDDIKEISKKAMSQSGDTPYDKMALIHHVVYRYTRIWIGRKKEKAEKKMYCSEFIAWLINLPDWWKKTPADVYKELSESKDWITLYEEVRLR